MVSFTFITFILSCLCSASSCCYQTRLRTCRLRCYPPLLWLAGCLAEMLASPVNILPLLHLLLLPCLPQAAAKGGGEGWQCPSFAPSNSLSCRSLHFYIFRFIGIVCCVSFILMFRCISVYILHHSCDLPHTLRCDGELPSGANKDKVKIVTIGVINKNIVGNLILLTSISSMILQQCHY